MSGPRSVPGKPSPDAAPKGEASRPAAVTVPKAAEADVAGEPVEIGGPKGLEPTRYGDWERKGRCIDF